MKKIVLILTVCALLLGLGGCKSAQSVVFSDDIRALVELPGGEVLSIDVEHWNTNLSGLYKINAKDGTEYVVSINNCILIWNEQSSSERTMNNE